MPRKVGRPIKIEPKDKVCKECGELKEIDCFSLEPIPTNPNLRRNQCKQCRSEKNNKRLRDMKYWSKKYKSMTDSERAVYIEKKSKQNKRRFKTSPEARNKRKIYSKSDKGIYVRYKADCNRRNRLKRKIFMDLTPEQFSDIINKPCVYCGNLSRGVDRIDSNKSYTLDNTQPCCKCCNEMKNNRTEVVFLEHIKQIINHRGI